MAPAHRRFSWLVSIVLVLLASGQLPPLLAQDVACKFEAFTYTNEGLTIRAGAFYLDDGQKHPVLVYNHGTPSSEGEGRPAWESIGAGLRCQIVRETGMVLFFAERRGYGGSDGMSFQAYISQGTRKGSSERGTRIVERLWQEAGDIETGIQYVANKPYVRPPVAIWGQSGGAVLALLLSSRAIPGLAGVIASGPGFGWEDRPDTLYGEPTAAAVEAGKKAQVPILLTVGQNDVRLEMVRTMTQNLRDGGKDITSIEYPGMGHSWSWSRIGSEVVKFLGRVVRIAR